jgi:ribulose-phosphate 3-epimerase
VDGGINPATAGRCAAAGADVFVAGEVVFGSGDIAGAIAALRAGASSRPEGTRDKKGRIG